MLPLLLTMCVLAGVSDVSFPFPFSPSPLFFDVPKTKTVLRAMNDGPPEPKPKPEPEPEPEPQQAQSGTNVMFPAVPVMQDELPSPTLPPLIQPSAQQQQQQQPAHQPRGQCDPGVDMALVLSCVRSGRVRTETSDELPPGWTILYRERQSGRMRTDKYYVSPQGKRYCSTREVQRALSTSTPDNDAPTLPEEPALKRPRDGSSEVTVDASEPLPQQPHPPQNGKNACPAVLPLL